MKCLSNLICVILIFSALMGKSDCFIKKTKVSYTVEYLFVGQLNYPRRSSLSNAALYNLTPTKYARLHSKMHTCRYTKHSWTGPDNGRAVTRAVQF